LPTTRHRLVEADDQAHARGETTASGLLLAGLAEYPVAVEVAVTAGADDDPVTGSRIGARAPNGAAGRRLAAARGASTPSLATTSVAARTGPCARQTIVATIPIARDERFERDMPTSFFALARSSRSKLRRPTR
jgi:hypothetical protein